MAYCKKCGKELKDNKHCNCKNGKFDRLFDVKDETEKFSKKDIRDNKAMAILSYFGPLALLPFFTAKESKFAFFHAKQGMNLFLVWIIYYISSGILSQIRIPGACDGMWFSSERFCDVTPWWVTVPLNLVAVLIVVISLIGIINVCQGKARELPFIGKMKIFK